MRSAAILLLGAVFACSGENIGRPGDPGGGDPAGDAAGDDPAAGDPGIAPGDPA